VNQPLRLEAGFLSWGRWILTERNPANGHLPSFISLQRLALPGLRWQWWPWAAGKKVNRSLVHSTWQNIYLVN
jgi:hypothetical protein